MSRSPTSGAASCSWSSTRSTSARSAPTSSRYIRRSSRRSPTKGATLVGVSVDHPYAHKAFQEKLGIEFPLLADFEPKGEVSRAYDTYYDGAGHGKRSLVLIDEEGVVEWTHESPSPLEIPGANLIFDALA